MKTSDTKSIGNEQSTIRNGSGMNGKGKKTINWLVVGKNGCTLWALYHSHKITYPNYYFLIKTDNRWVTYEM